MNSGFHFAELLSLRQERSLFIKREKSRWKNVPPAGNARNKWGN